MLLLNIKLMFWLQKLIGELSCIQNKRSFQDQENDTKMNIGPYRNIAALL